MHRIRFGIFFSLHNPIAVIVIAVAKATCPITSGCTSTFAIALIIKQGVPMFITMRALTYSQN